MRGSARRAPRSNVDPTFVLAALVTLVASFAAVRYGAQIGLGSIVLAAFFLGLVIAFVAAPWVAVSVTIVLFVLVPSLKVFTTPLAGSLKDIDVLAAICGAVAIGVTERRAPDRWILALVLGLLGLYVVNPGGGHGVAWAQGVRLVGEPLALLLVGSMLPNPRRTLRAALVALALSGAAVAIFGILQQPIGSSRLASWGYDYNVQIRFIGGYMRSFGTFDDPFAYAAFLLLAVAGVIFGLRRPPWTTVVLGLLVLGLVVSLVRTAALVGIAFLGIALVRRGLGTSGVLVAVAATLAGIALLATQATASESRVVTLATPTGGTAASSRPGTADLILNGRVSAWRAAVGDQPYRWIVGRGVGEVGTAAARAGSSLRQVGSVDTGTTTAVDSGYLATIADVGVIGLGVLLALLARLLALGTQAARAGLDEGWLAVALLASLIIDALTRASFTGFPTAFLGLLLVGIALAAARERQTPAA
jgi:hypothetical protein